METGFTIFLASLLHHLDCMLYSVCELCISLSFYFMAWALISVTETLENIVFNSRLVIFCKDVA